MAILQTEQAKKPSSIMDVTARAFCDMCSLSQRDVTLSRAGSPRHACIVPM
jgi:hypothetical protein